MADAPADPWSDRIVGYCTNVHACRSLEQWQTDLGLHIQRIRNLYCPQQRLPIGIWFPALLIKEMSNRELMAGFLEWSREQPIIPFTANAFPIGDFHETIVKHAVYNPNWFDDARINYTQQCTLLLFLMREMTFHCDSLSLSTLPLAWKKDLEGMDESILPYQLLLALTTMIGLGQQQAHLDLEPEPGCILENSHDVVHFFERVYSTREFQEHRKHLRVCHDICHAAVMFEEQAEMFRRYDDAGIMVGKVQVSNAIRVDFDALSPAEKPEALTQLKAFEEDRYLHQTCIRDNSTGEITFHEDLPLATSAAEQRGEPIGEWRVHFHVPIYLESIGLLSTTRDYIDDCLELMKPKTEVRHFEVETYAWNVLPPELQRPDLAEGIAEELIWLRERMKDPDS